MSTIPERFPPLLLLAGDGLTLLAVTWIGYASHRLSILNTRWLLVFLPLLVAWGFTSPWYGVYRPGLRCSPAGAWRAALAMLPAAALGLWLRGLLTGTMIVPVFVGVMMGVSALGMGLWRVLWGMLCKRSGPHG